MYERDVHSMNMKDLLDKFEAVVRQNERQRCYDEIIGMYDEMGDPDPGWALGIQSAANRIRPKKEGS